MKRLSELRCLVITGVTASGKTRLAVHLARKFQGEILSADSRQVYRGLDLGTGKDRDEYSSAGRLFRCICSILSIPARNFICSGFLQKRAEA